MTVVALLGCAASEPIDLPSSRGAGGSATGGGPSGTGGGATATGGALGTGGPTATGGALGTGGATATGGVLGTGGVTATGGALGTGGATATGGRIGTGGVTATGGKIGTGGVKGTGGATTGAGGTTSTDGGTVTFTEVYTEVIANNCFGSNCHNPGGGDRPSFSSQANCYNYFKNQGQLYPGQTASKSYLYFIMSGDPTATPPSPPYMPPTPNPNVSAADLALVAAWIASGALND
jgi:hypothetical protein